jgi:hypothetical protein
MSRKESEARNTIRELARRVAELAGSEECAHRRQLWNEVNSLRLPERPPVICHPGCWEELLPGANLVSQDGFHAGVEYQSRQALYKNDIGDDTVIEPWCPSRKLHLDAEPS